MSLIESVWADNESDDLLFENSTRTIDAESSAFDANDYLDFGNHSSDGFSMKQGHAKHQSIVLDHGHVAFEDQQLTGGCPPTNQNIPAAHDLQQQVERLAVASDSSMCHDRSVLGLKSDILGITTKSFSIGPLWC